MLEEKKCDALSSYMIHHSEDFKRYINNKQGANKRDLSSYLLIDVEMSDCSKISPLKAGLNSLQLYIHRCILELEEGVAVKSELTEEMWDLLDNYREWEVTKKVALYPENYLNPTLRKSATAEYKELQNTLMQGNLTDEEAASAYIKYFEDFAQLVNLQIVDSYYASEKQNLYIIGRTQAEPYTYYYRVGNFDHQNESIQKWLPWEKIEVQIPVSIAKMVCAFGKVFVFWLQRTKKEKQIEDVSVNDSSLSICYIFKKANGGWSAQQKLPDDVEIDNEFELKIRDFLLSKDYYNKLAEFYEKEKNTDHDYYVKLDNTVRAVSYDAAYSKDYKSWQWAKAEDYRKYCDKRIEEYQAESKKCKESIDVKVKDSKDVNETFNGKLRVVLRDEVLSILSMEKGFDNIEFALTKNFKVTSSKHKWAEKEYKINNSSNKRDALASIINAYETKKEQYEKDVTSQENKIKEDIRLKQVEINKLEFEVKELKDTKTKKEKEKQPLETSIDSMIQEVKDLEKSLSNLQQQYSIQDNRIKMQVERGKLEEVVKNLKKRLEDSQKSIKAKLLEKLKNLITEEADLNIYRNKIKEEVELIRSIDELIKKVKKLELKRNSSSSPFETKELDQEIEAKEGEKKENEEKYLKVLKQIEDLETGIVNKVDAEIVKLESESKQESVNQKQKDELNGKIESLKSLKLFFAAKQELIKLETEITVRDKIKTLTEMKKLTNEIDELDRKIETENERVKKLKTEKTNLENQIKTKYDPTALAKKKNEHFVELNREKKQAEATIEKLFSYEESISTPIVSSIGELYTEVYEKGSEIILTSGQQKLMSKEQEVTTTFKGFYGVYLWEIFFHIPTLIAYLFNQEQKFAEARKWYQYIFNPIKKGCDTWQFVPLKTKCDKESDKSGEKCDSGKLVDSLDSYKEADKKKTSYEKYIIMSYVDNLIDWGDLEFSKETWESINQATMLYIRAWDLLGGKPKKKGKHITNKPKNVCQLLDNKNNICKAEAAIPSNTDQTNTVVPIRTTRALDTTIYCDYFCTPENQDFIGLWDRVEDRLYKIRHCLDIKGKHLELSLFQPSIDPRQLISAAASGSTVRLSKIAQVTHYRFKYMITYAKSITDTVTQISSELLGVLEKKDAEALNLLYNKQEAIMANLMTTIKEKAIESLKEEAKALNASLDSAKYRKSHYENLINDGLSGYEQAAIGTSIAAVVLLAATVSPKLTAAILNLMPNIFGLACGGHDPGRSADTAASSIQTAANVLSNTSQNISTSASYERRAEDWKLQKTMATHDTEQISHQIEANKINQANAVQDLKAHKESIKQIREKEQFFRSKFTNQELYSWMKGELKSLYIRVYRLALEIARQAEWAYQYEIDNDKTFIQSGHWNNLKEGLLSGQKLKFDLEQLDKEYHDKNERRLEINKVISLKSLDPIALYELKTKSSCKFSLTEKLFDLDFPGHYARKIKDIKITIPAVVGPYENIHASLQQTSNQVVLKSEGAINAIKYLLNPSEEEQPENDLLRANWKPNQEIAISKADQDSGLFELSFGDERYLPFEGTGAISTWELSLPQATNRFDVSSISDVIIHLDYTALNGGEALSKEVKNLNQIKYYQGTLVMNLSSIYSEEWESLNKQRSSLLN